MINPNVIDGHILVSDPGGFDVAQRLYRPCNSLDDALISLTRATDIANDLLVFA